MRTQLDLTLCSRIHHICIPLSASRLQPGHSLGLQLIILYVEEGTFIVVDLLSNYRYQILHDVHEGTCSNPCLPVCLVHSFVLLLYIGVSGESDLLKS